MKSKFALSALWTAIISLLHNASLFHSNDRYFVSSLFSQFFFSIGMTAIATFFILVNFPPTLG